MSEPSTSPSSSSGSAAPPHRYSASLANEIEPKWQAWWAERETFRQPNPGEPGFDASKPKFYCLDMFPYPSGAGLHVGHPEGYTATDILCRYKLMNGFNVLHPMGWDAFGLPAEQYAIQTGVHPAETTRSASDNFRRQLQRFGFCYDWSREYATIDEDYYRWTQWIFLKLYDAWFDAGAKKARPIAALIEGLESGDLRVGAEGEVAYAAAGAGGIGLLAHDAPGVRRWHELSARERRAFIDDQRLAYLGEQTVNWCPKLGTALANEEVIDGRSERGGHPVVRTPLRQWMFRITAYAERLLEGLGDLDWPNSTKTMQAEWIGRSEGAEIEFVLDVEGTDPAIDADVPPMLRVFTTRPDTVFGATYMVVAPEPPLVSAALAKPRPETPVDALRAYTEAAGSRSDIERQEAKDKSGVFTGFYAINPATGERIPVWTSDYVLMGYGSGAIMAVPAHDQRDFEFAQAFGLAIRQVVYPSPLYPMWWVGNHTTPEELEGVGDEEGWLGVVADFMGYVTTNEFDPSLFHESFGTIINRRRRPYSDPPPEREAFAGPPSADAPMASGSRRGSVRSTWVEAIQEMKFTSAEDFCARMADPIRAVRQGEAYAEPGRAINSSNDAVDLNGLPTKLAKARAIHWLEHSGAGRRRINYRLRDWLFSRQRYWGEPFPIVFDEHGDHHAVDASKLPVALPPMDDYQPIESDTPTPLLGKATDWVRTTAGEAGVAGLDPDAPVTRETNTMPGWAGSCWYYLRYCDPKNAERLAGEDAERYWMDGGVDLYIGGAEHAVLHLLYARFWHQALHDLGAVTTPEPFTKLFHQGRITSFTYQRPDKSRVPIDEVDESGDDAFVERATGEAVTQVVAKMSKSLKNVINPDDVIAEHGADVFRLYEMYMGPLEASKPWNTRDIVGLSRFMARAWRLCVNEQTGEAVVAETADDGIERLLHKTIAKVGEDIERLSFNTAIAAMIEFVNAASKADTASGVRLTRDQADRFVRILAPFAPHAGEELWAKLDGPPPVSLAGWPEHDPAMLKADEVEVPVQIMGKVRARLMMPADADAKAMEALAMGDERVVELLAGKTVRKVVAVPGRMVNIVAN